MAQKTDMVTLCPHLQALQYRKSLRCKSKSQHGHSAFFQRVFRMANKVAAETDCVRSMAKAVHPPSTVYPTEIVFTFQISKWRRPK
jgi:hypothetical protein